MEAVIINYRRGRHTQNTGQIIIKINGIDTKEKASKLLNKKVIWKSPANKEIMGIIKNLHGNTGALRAAFEKGLPGQAIGTKIKIE